MCSYKQKPSCKQGPSYNEQLYNVRDIRDQCSLHLTSIVLRPSQAIANLAGMHKARHKTNKAIANSARSMANLRACGTGQLVS